MLICVAAAVHMVTLEPEYEIVRTKLIEQHKESHAVIGRFSKGKRHVDDTRPKLKLENTFSQFQGKSDS